MDRPGFQRLVTEVCAGQVGAIFCIEASRLARNGRDWHHLIELCGLVGTVVIDPDGVYDPCLMNDRLLLGLKGTMSEFELNLFRQRSMEAIRMKAGRGELRFCLPVGFCWSHDGKVEIDPDTRVREAITLAFRKMDELGSVRQVVALVHRRKAVISFDGPRRVRPKDRMEATHLQRLSLRDYESNVCRCVRIRQDRAANACGGWAGQKNQWPS